MCGRFTLTVEPFELMDGFQLELFPEDYQPSFNIAPSHNILAAVQSNSGRKAGFLKWGLVPYWVKESKQWKPLINARAETIAEKASFRHLLNQKRCIIFADSFYEWKAVGGQKSPYRIMRRDDKPFAFAGLWDRNSNSPKSQVTCTIITTDANPMVQNVHDRMPVILESASAIEAWINVKEASFQEAQSYIKPLPEELMKLYEVSSLVNSPISNGIECIQPIAVE